MPKSTAGRADLRPIARPLSPRRIASLLAAPVAGLVLAGCSGGVSSLNPFNSSSSVSEIDTVFLAAAGNWDRNHDGVVTCDEWKAYATELFDAADTNRDGMLTPDEYASIIKTDRMFETANFKYWDSNGDGKISRAEFIERPNPAFTLLDKSKSCQLTSTELSGGRQLLQQKKPIVGPPPETQKGPGSIGR